MNRILRFICGFCAIFSLVIFGIILLFIWPNPLPSFAYYPIRDTQIATLFAATIAGLLAGLTAILLGETIPERLLGRIF